MEILQTAIIGDIKISINDSWDIGNGRSVSIKELFKIDEQVYMATVTDNEPMLSLKVSLDSDELVTPNRYINLAELWVKRNHKLFENK